MKKNILIFNNYFFPGSKFGGPIQSIKNLIDWLAGEYNFKIITLDRDFLSDKSYESVNVDKWNKIFNTNIFYAKPENLTFNKIKDLLYKNEYEILYLNSFFNYKFTIVPLFICFLARYKIKSKILIAPRGELSIGALEQKNVKKKIYIHLFKRMHYKNKIHWHATDQAERDDIVRELNVDNSQIFEAPNLPSKSQSILELKSAKLVNCINLIYLSRVTPKKNLLYVLKILSEIEDLNVTLDIYGTVDDVEYWNKCLKNIKILPNNIVVNVRGHLEHTYVKETISKYDLFILPTKGENFGHAIIESIQSGTPVLISDKTPWKDLENKGLGWDINLNAINKFRDVVKRVGMLNKDEMLELKIRVQRNSNIILADNGLLSTKALFDAILNSNE